LFSYTTLFRSATASASASPRSCRCRGASAARAPRRRRRRGRLLDGHARRRRGRAAVDGDRRRDPVQEDRARAVLRVGSGLGRAGAGRRAGVGGAVRAQALAPRARGAARRAQDPAGRDRAPRRARDAVPRRERGSCLFARAQRRVARAAQGRRGADMSVARAAFALVLLGAAAAASAATPDVVLPGMKLTIGAAKGAQQETATAIKILLALTVLSLAPAILIAMTSFTPCVIVLTMLRQPH